MKKRDRRIGKRKHLAPACPSCGHDKMLARWCWDDDQVTDHAHNVFTCEDCGAVFIQRVAKDSGLTVMHKTGKVDTYPAGKSPFSKKYFAALSSDKRAVIDVDSVSSRLRNRFPPLSLASVVSITEEQYHAFKRGEDVIWVMGVKDRKKKRGARNE